MITLIWFTLVFILAALVYIAIQLDIIMDVLKERSNKHFPIRL